MKIKSLFFYYFLVQVFFVQAQSELDNTTITWGPEYKDLKLTAISNMEAYGRIAVFDDIIGYDNSGVYAIRIGLRMMALPKYYLEHYDQEMNQLNSTAFDFKSYHSVIMLDGELWLLTTSFDSKDRKKQLYIQKIDKKTLAVQEGKKNIAEAIIPDGLKNKDVEFNLGYSQDRSKILISLDLLNGKIDNDKLYLKVLDGSFQSVWEKNIDLEYEKGLFKKKGVCVDKAGNVYVFGPLLKEEKKYIRKGKPNYEYKLIQYSNKEQPQEYEVRLPKKFITDMQIAIDNDGNIVCAGFYANEGSFDIKGVYIQKIDIKTKDILQSNFKEFKSGFVNQVLYIPKLKKKDEEIRVGYFKYKLEIVINEDDEITLIGEQYLTRKAGVTTSGGTVNYTYHYYNDIIIAKSNSNREINWIKKIPKKQVTPNFGSRYFSYFRASVGDKNYFIFNDNSKNLNYKEGRTDKAWGSDSEELEDYTVGKETTVTIVSVDKSGRINKARLFDEQKQTLFYNKACEQITDDEIIIYGQWKKKYQFAKVKFD